MRLLTALLALTLSALTSWADLPRPKKDPVRMDVRTSNDSNPGAVLRIPSKFVRAEGTPAAGYDWREIIAGLLLTLAIVCGGFWMVRRRRLLPATATFLFLAAVAATVGALADIRRPGPPNDNLVSTLRADIARIGTLSGTIEVQVVNSGDRIELLIPQQGGAQRPGSTRRD